MLTLLDTENADRNLTSQVTVLTHTPSAARPTVCVAQVLFGDGTKNLNGTGGDFELTITVGGQTVQPDPQVIAFSTAVRAAVWTVKFPVHASAEVIIKAKSPNAGDTDVDVTAYLYEVDQPDEVRDAVHDGTVLQGTVESTGASTTVIPIKTLSITLTVADQLKGRVILFSRATVTAALRGQGAPIDSSTTSSVTLAAGDALTTTPAEDDEFSII